MTSIPTTPAADSLSNHTQKVFVYNVDAPVPRAIARLLAHTPIGIRRATDEDQGNEDPSETPAGPTYEIIGTFSAAGEKYKEGTQDDSLPSSRPQTAGSQRAETPGRKFFVNRKGVIPVPDKYVPAGTMIPWVSRVIKRDDTEAIKAALLECDVIIYDILQSPQDANMAVEFLAEAAPSFADRPKTFILVSTVMTWARTKFDEEPDGGITEEDYRKRKPHPNFKEHTNVEKALLKIPREGLFKTYIIGSGIVYHPGNGLFHYYLKTAWQCQRDFVMFGEGDNFVPSIHIQDLANVVAEVVEVQPETRFILAIDDGKQTMLQILKGISDSMGTGKIIKVSKEDSFLQQELSQAECDMLQVNLKLDSGCVKDFGFEWKYETGLLENLQPFLSEYREYRGLKPINVLVYGPPLSGKTTLAKKIAEHYELHYIEVEQYITDSIAELEAKSKTDDVDAEIKSLKSLLADLTDYSKTAEGQAPAISEHVLQVISARLRSMPCKNHGYVLDGFPVKYLDAVQLFQASAEEAEKSEDKSAMVDKGIFPHFVFALETSDDALKERMLTLPSSELVGKNSEEVFLHRLEEFRHYDEEDKNVLYFFDQQDVFPTTFSTETTASTQIYDSMVKAIGRPRNYGPSDEQLLEIKRKKLEEKARLKAAAEEEKRKKDQAEAERQSKAEQEWKQRYTIIQKEEAQALEAQSAPLRDYLIRNVMPSLTAGLIELCKTRPEDPIDFLAEFLFRHSEST